MSSAVKSKGANMEGEDEDLEMLRQAALKTLGMNRNNRPSWRDNPNQARGTPPRRKTNGNLIEIQPTELGSGDFGGAGEEEEVLNSEDYIVEEFVLEGSDVSINSSDCDEVIEEVIVSDVEGEGSTDSPPAGVRDGRQHGAEEEDVGSRKQSRSRSRSVSSHRSSESDAVSIKSSYSLIMGEDNDEFQSVESKFYSKKVQKQKSSSNNDSTADKSQQSTNTEEASNSSRSRSGRRSRSPLPFRSRPVVRRSRSRDIIRSNVIRKSKSRSRSPGSRRRNHSPLASSSGREARRPFRTNSNERSQQQRRVRRSRSRSPPSSRVSPNRRFKPRVDQRRIIISFANFRLLF